MIRVIWVEGIIYTGCIQASKKLKDKHMDENVKQAMAKWPNVPHCYGWLGLDARGNWRMRDERAQTLGSAGDKIAHSALLGFINRNYTSDSKGRWYFQNGPQRVYVNLEATPYIARTDPAQGFVLHTGEPVSIIDAAWMTDKGQLVLEAGSKVALVDDRDMAQCMAMMCIDDAPVSDEQLLAWLDQKENTDLLYLVHPSRKIPVRHLAYDAMATHFAFVKMPQADDN